jgi:hypothetical protein
MNFKNCILEDNEKREYRLPDGTREVFTTGTVDYDNDIRLHCYENGPIMELSDVFSFVIDYKGNVYYKKFMRDLTDGGVTWSAISSLKELDEQVVQALREALMKYAIYGFSYDDDFMIRNEKSKVHIAF